VERLAAVAGILPSYTDQRGGKVVTSDHTRIALLEALGYDVSSEQTIARELERLADEQQDCLIEPVAVVRVGTRAAQTLRVRLPYKRIHNRHIGFTIRPEGGEAVDVEPRTLHKRSRTLVLDVPIALGPGYHTIQISAVTPSGHVTASQTRVVHAGSCMPVTDCIGERRAFGIWTNLYSVRSETNFGVGDLTDLEGLVRWASGHGAEFVGISPLHSLRNRNGDVSPYSPTSRLFNNEIYLDVTTVPEFKQCTAAQQIVRSVAFRRDLERVRSTDRIQYDDVLSLKRTVLDLLFKHFVNVHHHISTQRYDEFSAYKKRSGSDLLAYATYRALEEHCLGRGLPGDWNSWPVPLRTPESSEVSEFRSSHSDAIDFHCYTQFVLDGQLRSAAMQARSAMSIGLYGDLALGSAATGADAWAHQNLFVDGAQIGAPPDDFAADGQNWGLPPMAPTALRAARYRYWISLLRAALRHSGALRIDHVMGLFRQFWIPRGLPGSSGAYVEYPANDLLGILALESRRNSAIVVGEDLGTVPRGFQARLARWNILSSRVLYFERDRRGAFRPARQYSRRAMVTANTHDQAPLAGYSSGKDLILRHRAGAFESTERFEDEMAERSRAMQSLRQRLEVTTQSPHNEADAAQHTRAVYAFLAKTPAPLVGISLDDLAREEDPVNLPGVGHGEYSSWTRKMHGNMECLVGDAAVTRTLDDVALERSRPGKAG
jgi:4-alpha-glucanotransferase